MNLHEYQAKEILKRYGIPMPPFIAIASLSELDSALEKLGTEEVVIKIQVHAGGRGKAGGVKIAKNITEARKLAGELFSLKMVNEQTGPQGVMPSRLLISPLSPILKEYYIGAVIDRKSGEALLIATPEGGVEIEEVARTSPEKILKLPIPLDGKLKNYKLWEAAKFMGWKEEREEGMHIIRQLAKAFIELDASLLEINPLVSTGNGALCALDAKLSIDDNALFRHRELAEMFDSTQINGLEAEAKLFDLSYIALDGQIGCMVNGAGLAMATMDIIEYYGGKPANFLDVGGGASKEKVAQGFKILLKDPHVKAILVNIFGGIMNCETLAEGIVEACRVVNLRVPLIVRMEGTNVDKGRKVLADSKLKITVAHDLAQAAKESVEAVK
jgi:succinyl-CoA synthetase beta subunit